MRMTNSSNRRVIQSILFFSLKLKFLLIYCMHMINLPLVLFFDTAPLPVIYLGWKFCISYWDMLFQYLNPFSRFWFIVQCRPKSYTWIYSQGIVWHPHFFSFTLHHVFLHCFFSSTLSFFQFFLSSLTPHSCNFKTIFWSLKRI